MKISVTIFSLFILLSSFFPKMDTMELLKVPHLIEHFIQDEHHQNESFLEFLADHYGDNHHHNDEHKDKGCFPFQGDCSCISPAFVIPKLTIFEAILIQESTDVNSFYTEPTSSEFLDSIFQPPQV